MENDNKKSDFENIRSEQGVVAEFFEFLKENKKWWMIPIIAILLLFGLLIVLGGSSMAPFIYALF